MARRPTYTLWQKNVFKIGKLLFIANLINTLTNRGSGSSGYRACLVL